MPNNTFSRESFDYGARVQLQRHENDFAAVKAENEALKKGLADANKAIAAMKLERIENEVNASLDSLEAEGYTVKRDVDHQELCRLSKDKREERIQFMRETRAKKDVTPLPGGGKAPIDTANAFLPGAGPVQLSRDAFGPAMPGDPALGASAVTDDWDTLRSMVGAAKAKGVSVKNIFDDPTLLNGTAPAKVR